MTVAIRCKKERKDSDLYFIKISFHSSELLVTKFFKYSMIYHTLSSTSSNENIKNDVEENERVLKRTFMDAHTHKVTLEFFNHHFLL